MIFLPLQYSTYAGATDFVGTLVRVLECHHTPSNNSGLARILPGGYPLFLLSVLSGQPFGA